MNRIDSEVHELKQISKVTNEAYANEFLKKSQLLKIKVKKETKRNYYNKRSYHNIINIYNEISITSDISKKSKRYKILMIKYQNSKKEKIKKFDYALLNEFLELILYKNQFFIILFFLKHFKRFKIIHDKDYSLCCFIIIFALVMIFLLIGAIPMGIAKDRYFHRF